MDFDSLKNQVSNLTLYDIKAGVRKVQNAVMNYTEMEAKVREATNNEPWGTSTTQMQEIASATFNYQLLNEIMPMIYKRFTEKSAEEWRQIYKALQLMEFLVKHGSERVVDDARSHMSLLKMLRQFYFTDSNGKDQGVNVRHRSKELVDLLSDVERIRAERKKARAQASKTMGGVGSNGAMGGYEGGSSSQYGGFGDSASFGGFSGGVYGDGGGFGGAGGNEDEYSTSNSRSRTNNDEYEEYDEYNEGAAAGSSGRSQPSGGRRKPDSAKQSTMSTSSRTKKPVDTPKPKAPEVDLLGFGDDEPVAAPAPTSVKVSGVAAQTSREFDDDDFDDFQSAAPSVSSQPASSMLSTISPPTASGAPLAAPQGRQAQQFGNLLGSTSQPLSASTTPGVQPLAQQPRSTGLTPAAPNYFTSVSVQQHAASPSASSAVTSPAPSIGGMSSLSSATTASSKPKLGSTSTNGSSGAKGGDAFANLLGGTSLKSKSKSAGGMTMQEMAKQKSSAGLWGPNATPVSSTASPAGTGSMTPMSGNGSMGGAGIRSQGASTSGAAGGGGGGALDDLLG